MYKVKMDGHVLYSPVYPQAVLTEPQLELETGYAGIFTAAIPPENPMYGMVHCRKSMVSVFQDEKEIFYGEVRKLPKVDRNRNKEIYCVGALSFLADSIQPQAEYHDMTPYGMLKKFLDIHNEQVEDRKKIFIGEVTITDPNDSLYRYTNYENTLSVIREKLVSRLGGVLRLRHTTDGLFLDWVHISEYGKHNSQPIEFGLNLLDYSETLTAEDIVTALIPLGAKIGTDEDEVLERYTDIKTVNNGKNYIVNESAVRQFGYIWATNHWDDVTLPSNLKEKGEQWLSETQYETMTLSLTAADLSGIGQDYESFGEGDMIHCLAKPYGCDIVLPVQKLVIPLQKPAERKLELSAEREKTYTEQQADAGRRTQQTVEETQYAMNQRITDSVNNLTSMVTGTSGGYKLSEYDENGLWVRDLYMDAPDVRQAVNILQISKNGIAASTSGYNGPYTVGMMINGLIVGSRIAANSVDTDQLSVGLNAWIKGTDDGLESKVEKNGIVSAINQSSETVSINAKKINLNGAVSANENFKIKTDGSMETVAGKISGFIIKDDHLMYGNYVNYTNWLSMCTPHGGKGDVYMGEGGISTDSWAGSGNVKSVKLTEGVIEFCLGAYSCGKVGLSTDTVITLEFMDSQGNTVARVNRGQLVVDGDLIVKGSKSRGVDTDSYGDRLVYCYEMATPYFGDIGSGRTDEDGVCIVMMDPVFTETLNERTELHVFLQTEGKGTLTVRDKTPEYFIAEGTPDTAFSWEVKAVQRKEDTVRLESPSAEPDIPESEDIEKGYLAEVEELMMEQEGILYGTD